MKSNKLDIVFAVKTRYPQSAPFKYVLFDNEQAANDYKNWWACFANKRCVGAIDKLKLKENIPDDIFIYSSLDEAVNDIMGKIGQKYNLEGNK